MVAIQIAPYEVIWSQEVTEPDGKKRKGINTITDIVDIEQLPNGQKIIHRKLKWLDEKGNYYIKSDQLDYENFSTTFY